MNKEKVYEIGQAYIRLDFKATDEFKEAFEQFLLYKGKQYAKEYYNKELLIDGFFLQLNLKTAHLNQDLKFLGKLQLVH